MPSLFSRLSARRRVRMTLDTLSALSDAQLADVGIRRFDIARHAREALPIEPVAPVNRPIRAGEGLSYAG